MIGWLKLTNEQRRISLSQASIISGITEKAIEKDWWVTLSLKALFATSYADHLIFKGGTSLSKGWKLIERFSEDIDIALDPEAFGRIYEKAPSHRYVKTLKKEACTFTSTVLKNALEQEFDILGIPDKMIEVVAAEVPVTIPDWDPQTLLIRYPSLYPPHPYLADEVKAEFSARSLKEPFSEVSIHSILSDVFPNNAYEEKPFQIPAVEPRKTLLEKAFLLHEKLMISTPEKLQGDRQSRHIYDLVRMTETEVDKIALSDQNLYTNLVEHRRNYIRQSGVDYDTLHYSTLSFIPEGDFLETFRNDYKTMQASMIYGSSHSFDEMLDKLKLLNGRFRLINDPRPLEEIIVSAMQQILTTTDNFSEGKFLDIEILSPASYKLKSRTSDKLINYIVQFVKRDGKLVFNSIKIQQ